MNIDHLMGFLYALFKLTNYVTITEFEIQFLKIVKLTKLSFKVRWILNSFKVTCFNIVFKNFRLTKLQRTKLKG